VGRVFDTPAIGLIDQSHVTQGRLSAWRQSDFKWVPCQLPYWNAPDSDKCIDLVLFIGQHTGSPPLSLAVQANHIHPSFLHSPRIQHCYYYMYILYSLYIMLYITSSRESSEPSIKAVPRSGSPCQECLINTVAVRASAAAVLWLNEKLRGQRRRLMAFINPA